MSKQLEFMDCPNCGKRILTTATECHHCHYVPRTPLSSNQSKQIASSRRPRRDDDDDLTEHMSLEHGGYDNTDDFDYDNYLAEEFPDQTDQRPRPRIKLWVWVTAWLLIIAMLFPLVLQFMSTQ